jgi:hypothetical protein
MIRFAYQVRVKSSEVRVVAAYLFTLHSPPSTNFIGGKNL